MAGKRKVKLNFRRGSPLLKAVVLAALVLSTVALLGMRGAILSARAQTEDLRMQAQQLEQENEKLETDISLLGTVQSIVRIAEEKLGLIEPGSILFQDDQQVEEIGGSK